MDFRDNARLDASQVEDVGGRSGLPMGGIAAGGGTIGIIVLVVTLLLGGDPFGGGDGAQPLQPGSDLAASCRTGADADQSEKCRTVGVVNSVQRYWTDSFTEAGREYRTARTVLFTGSVQTGCGNATSAVGPFYCPSDERVYLDLGFFEQLEQQFGARNGPFAQAYVIGHEYGHHVQNLLGTSNRVRPGDKGADSGSVRLELQADCYAGVWAQNAVETGLYEKPFTDQDIQEALGAAQAVGDDRIQQRGGGRVDPESFTHGTSEQRKQWFVTGYQSGDPNRCDTFAGSI